jgi:hypothetical protein
MKAIKTNAIITSLSSKKDGSLGLRVETPELTPDEKVAFMELQGINLTMLIEATDFESKEIKVVKSEIETKSPSQRLRAVIFVLWKQQGCPGEFSDFYLKCMEKLIEQVKQRLDERTS